MRGASRLRSSISAPQIAIYQGDLERGERLVAEGLARGEQLGHAGTIASAFQNIGQLATRRGRYAEARLSLRKAFERFSENEQVVSVAECLERFGETAAHEGLAREAVRMWGAAAAMRDSTGAAMFPVDRVWYDEAVRLARASLSEDAFASAWREGGSVDARELVEQASGTLPKG